MADQILETKIKEDWISIILSLLDTASGETVYIQIGKANKKALASFDFEKQKDGEGAVEFAERYIEQFMRASVKANNKGRKFAQETEAWRAIEVAEDKVPDDLIIKT